MQFSELKEQAQQRAYGEYVAAIVDKWNRENILPIEEYDAEADWDGLEFHESLEAV